MRQQTMPIRFCGFILSGAVLFWTCLAHAIPQTFDLNMPVGVIQLNPDAFGPLPSRFTTVVAPPTQHFEQSSTAMAAVDIGHITKASALTTVSSSIAAATVYYRYFTTAAFLTLEYQGITNTQVASEEDGDASARFSIRMGALTDYPKVTIESSTGTILGFTRGRIDEAAAEIVGQRQSFYSTGLDQVVTNHLFLQTVLGGPVVLDTSHSSDSGFITVPTCPFSSGGFSGCSGDPNGRVITVEIEASTFGKNSWAFIDPIVSLPANELGAILQPLGSLSTNDGFPGAQFVAHLAAAGYDPSVIPNFGSVPEPSSLLLMGVGYSFLIFVRRRQRGTC
jgi:hypothetical protein